MQFNELVFLAFFSIVLLLHNLPLSWTIRKFNLLWLSYVFYAAWNPPFVVLLWVSTVIDWYVGHWLHRATGKAARRWLLLLSLCVNLGMLFYFKYGTFLVENFAALMRVAGVDWEPLAPSIVLPVGISFYTFQTLSYSLDIYNRKMAPWKSFLDYALFVTFFPQLVAGPIVRARQFLPQCLQSPTVTLRQFGWGMTLFVIGVFQKVVIADGILADSVEKVFDRTDAATFVDGWVGSMGFACQVFCDFAGYSICAIGVAKCLGFVLPMNFNYPLASVGFAEFWRRWHMTLSTWLRDYVYLPLGGNRVGYVRWTFNLLFTWSLIGLWHGAAWRFVLWGVVSGVWIVLERVARELAPPLRLWSRTWMLFVFACIQFIGFTLSLLVFRAPNFERLGDLSGPMFFGTPDDRSMILGSAAAATTFATCMSLFVWHWFMRARTLESVADRLPWPVKSTLIAVMVCAIVLARAPSRAFIYFQF